MTRNLCLAMTFFVFCQVAFAGTKTHISEADLKIDYFAVLGLRYEDEPSSQQIVTAYRAKIKELHPDRNGSVQILDAQLLVDAKEVLTNGQLREEYIRRRHNLNVQEMMRNLPQSPASNVGLIDYNGYLMPVQSGLAFNSAHQEKTVAYFRAHPDKNYVIWHSEGEVDGRTPKTEFVPAGTLEKLEPKWTKWNKDAGAIEAEFQRLTALSKTPERPSVETFALAKAFYYWWFAQPESLPHPEFITRALAEMPENSWHRSTLMQASLSDPAWRTRDWAQTLLTQPGSFFALAEVAGTPELISEVDIIAALAQSPQMERAPSALMRPLVASPDGLALSSLISSALTDKDRAWAFLSEALASPMWREKNPDLISQALLVMGRETAGSRDNVVRYLLTKPDAVHHPEWLEILIKTDRHDYLNIHLNGLLALDQWYNHPYLRAILYGSAPTVEGLRRANWKPLRSLPGVEAKLLASSPRPTLKLIHGGLTCDQRLEKLK